MKGLLPTADLNALDGALCYRLARPDADSKIGPDLWFGTDLGDWRNGNAMEAVQVCRVCPVRLACVQQAVRRNEQHGIWGGVDFSDPGQKRRAKSLGLRGAA